MITIGSKHLRKRYLGDANVGAINQGGTNIWPYITDTSYGQWIITASVNKTSLPTGGGTITVTHSAKRTITYTWVDYAENTTTQRTTTKDENGTSVISSNIGIVSGNLITVKENTSTESRTITITVSCEGVSKSLTVVQEGVTITNPEQLEIYDASFNKVAYSNGSESGEDANWKLNISKIKDFNIVGYIKLLPEGSYDKSDIKISVLRSNWINYTGEDTIFVTNGSNSEYSGQFKIGDLTNGYYPILYKKLYPDISNLTAFDSNSIIFDLVDNDTDDLIGNFSDVVYDSSVESVSLIGEFFDLAADFTSIKSNTQIGLRFYPNKENTDDYVDYYPTKLVCNIGTVTANNGYVTWNGTANTTGTDRRIIIYYETEIGIGYIAFTQLSANSTVKEFPIKLTTDSDGNHTISISGKNEDYNGTVKWNFEVSYTTASGETGTATGSATTYPTVSLTATVSLTPEDGHVIDTITGVVATPTPSHGASYTYIGVFSQ